MEIGIITLLLKFVYIDITQYTKARRTIGSFSNQTKAHRALNHF